MPGTPQKGWATKAKCTGAGNGNGGCGAELRVEYGDLYLTYSHCRDETDTFVTFTCAACGVGTDLPNSKRPPDWTSLPSKDAWQRRGPPKLEMDVYALVALLDRVDVEVASLPGELRDEISGTVDKAKAQGWRGSETEGRREIAPAT